MKKFITAIMTGLLLFSCWKMASVFVGHYEAAKEYERDREAYAVVIHHEEEKETDAKQESPEIHSEINFPERNIDYDSLSATNEDFNGWIYYGDGGVDYPVVIDHGFPNGEYMYLETTFEGKKNSSGCIFMLGESDPSMKASNTFIYGHNMKNGTMFGSLKKVFRNPDEAKDPYIFFWTKNRDVIKYRVFAVYVVEDNSKMYSIPQNPDEYKEYLEDALKMGSIEKRIPFSEDEKSAMKNCASIITLSTCYGKAGTSQRLLVQAVEIQRKTVN